MKRHLLILTLLGLGAGSQGRAESMKQFYNDGGLYSAMGPMNAIPFSLRNNHSLTEPSNEGNVPEGKKYFSMTAQGDGWGGFGLFNVTQFGGFTIANRDFSDYFPPSSNGNFRFWLKSSNTLRIEIQGQPGPGLAQKYGQDVASTGGEWKEFEFPFAFPVQGGIDIHNVQSPFISRKPDGTDGTAMSWQVDHVRWDKGVNHLEIFPGSVRVNPGKRRQFTIEGRAGSSASSDFVDVYAAFSAPAGLASIATDNGLYKARSVIITGGSGAGNITATDSYDNKSINGSIQVTNDNLDASYGLLSETIPGVTLDTDSRLGTHQQGITVNVGDSPDRVEGTKSLVSTVTLGANDFAGWYINWGLDSDNQADTRNMADYYDGSIQFWFKASPSLNGKVQVGIRSGNVPAGAEFSSDRIKASYARDGASNIFDGQWHPIVIPLAQWAKAPPWADLSRTKVFFAIYVITDNSGGANGTFYIDNLRWDTRTPGAVSKITVVPNPVLVPLNSKRLFTAYGLDSNNVPVDIMATWSVQGGIGTLSRTTGITSLLSAVNNNASGSITVNAVGKSSSTNVTVAPVVYTQSHNVYTDLGSGGFVGVDQQNGGSMTLSEPSPGVSGDPLTYRRANMTLSGPDAYAVWFTEEQNGARFMRFYNQGYLHFWVRTTVDLQFSIRSSNIPAGTELSKFRLSELGVPLDGNFQQVLLALPDFKAKEPRLDFDNIKTYFVIGGIANQIGNVSNAVFDIDDVRWLTSNPDVPTEAKVYQGLKEKQQASGLVRSFETLAEAVTYDQALAAMNYTYRKDTALSKKVFDVYLGKFNAGGFAGFHNTYDVTNPSTILDDDRMAGPNAWLLLALIHYRNVTASTSYDAMIDGLAAWLKSLQAADGGVTLGFDGATPQAAKSTEHNFDCYAAFQAYAKLKGNAAYTTSANNIRNWLITTVYDAGQRRFHIGTKGNGSLDTDKALDAHSWAPLALSSYSFVLGTAESDFRNSKTCDLTGVPVDGFDMGGQVGQPATYKDAVWLEGTAQMALAYLSTGNFSSADYFIREVEKAIVPISPTGQGMAYATNGGTGYGGHSFMMNSQHAAVSSMAWYLFARRNFNPFRPFPIYSAQPKTIATNVAASSVTWTVSVPAGWVRANQFIQLEAQPISIDPWGMQIYTDNANLARNLRFVDPTPAITSNPDSDPAGLLFLSGLSTTTKNIPLAWRILDSTSSVVPPAVRPYTLFNGPETPDSFTWSYIKDRNTPAIDGNGDGVTGGELDGTQFSDGEEYVIIRNSDGLHSAQGPAGFFPGSNLNSIFLEADFGTAAAQSRYETQITIEFFLE